MPEGAPSMRFLFIFIALYFFLTPIFVTNIWIRVSLPWSSPFVSFWRYLASWKFFWYGGVLSDRVRSKELGHIPPYAIRRWEGDMFRWLEGYGRRATVVWQFSVGRMSLCLSNWRLIRKDCNGFIMIPQPVTTLDGDSAENLKIKLRGGSLALLQLGRYLNKAVVSIHSNVQIDSLGPALRPFLQTVTWPRLPLKNAHRI